MNQSRLTKEGRKTLEKIDIFIAATITSRIGLLPSEYDQLIANLPSDIREQVLNEFIYRDTKIFKVVKK